MQAEDFFRVISEVEFICDDIDELKEQVDLTKSENHKISQAITFCRQHHRVRGLGQRFWNSRQLQGYTAGGSLGAKWWVGARRFVCHRRR